MKRIVLPTSLIVCGLALAGSAFKEHPIEMLDRQFEAAMKEGNARKVSELYAEKAVVFLPDAEKVEGREELRKNLDAFFSQMTVRDCKLEGTYSTSGDLSAGWGTFKLTMAPKAGGEEMTGTGRFTGVAQKQADGKWLYIVDHASVPMPAQG